MTTSRASFLVAGIGYLALGLVTVGFGLLWILPALSAARREQVSAVQFIPLATFALIIVLFTLFYVAMGLSILKRRCRQFVIVGAGISCLLIPFGTVLGLIFLLWTRREWPVSVDTVR